MGRSSTQKGVHSDPAVFAFEPSRRALIWNIIVRMNHLKFPILMVLGAAVAAGCWQQQQVLVGTTDTDSDSDTDSDTDTDSDADTDTDTDTNSDFEKWGIVNLVHTALADSQYGAETLILSAVVYSEQYGPLDGPDYEGTFLSKNGVECEIYYHSGMAEPPPPEPPAEVDVGRIMAAPEEAEDILTIDFDADEGAYTVDYRTANSVDLPLPDWLVENVDFYFFGTGLGNTDPFLKPASLPLHTQLTSPFAEGPVVIQNGDGDFVMGWLPVSEGQVTLTLNFNLDWDDATFICRPDQSVTELVVPQEWINEYTWGGGSDIVIAVTNSYHIAAGQTLLEARAVSAHRHTGNFQTQ